MSSLEFMCLGAMCTLIGRGGPLVGDRSPYLVGVGEVPMWIIGPLT